MISKYSLFEVAFYVCRSPISSGFGTNITFMISWISVSVQSFRFYSVWVCVIFHPSVTDPHLDACAVHSLCSWHAKHVLLMLRLLFPSPGVQSPRCLWFTALGSFLLSLSSALCSFRALSSPWHLVIYLSVYYLYLPEVWHIAEGRSSEPRAVVVTPCGCSVTAE